MKGVAGMPAEVSIMTCLVQYNAAWTDMFKFVRLSPLSPLRVLTRLSVGCGIAAVNCTHLY